MTTERVENKNGDTPWFLFLQDSPDGYSIFGPYTEGFGQHLQETFGGVLLKETIINDCFGEEWKENEMK